MVADVLRLVDRFDGLADYRACKAHADQMAHFAAADAARR